MNLIPLQFWRRTKLPEMHFACTRLDMTWLVSYDGKFVLSAVKFDRHEICCNPFSWHCAWSTSHPPVQSLLVGFHFIQIDLLLWMKTGWHFIDLWLQCIAYPGVRLRSLKFLFRMSYKLLLRTSFCKFTVFFSILKTPNFKTVHVMAFVQHLSGKNIFGRGETHTRSSATFLDFILSSLNTILLSHPFRYIPFCYQNSFASHVVQISPDQIVTFTQWTWWKQYMIKSTAFSVVCETQVNKKFDSFYLFEQSFECSCNLHLKICSSFIVHK